MGIHCNDKSCTYLNDFVCTKYNKQLLRPICSKEIVFESNETYLKEFANFKDFVGQLETCVENSDIKEGIWKDITSFGMGMKVVDCLSELVKNIECFDNKMTKESLLNLAATSYKMWRNL